MNQTKIFYLLSLIAIFFIGYYYSQFNIQPVKPEIITINNDDEVKKQKSNNLSLQLQLEELNNQLIFSLDELKITSKKLTRSLGENRALLVRMKSNERQLIKTKLECFNDRFFITLTEHNLEMCNAFFLENEKTIKELKKALSDAELDLELIKFDLEIAEANLRAN